MHRIDAPGFAPGNLFTEGNPALGIPATEVSDDWLNDVQEEIVKVIEGQGITLVKGLQTQLETAILNMIGLGGTAIKLDPLLNNTVNQVVTGLLFDKATIKAAIIMVDIHRETDSSNKQETGIWIVTHDTKDDIWRLAILITSFDNSGTVPNIIAATGQVRATTNDLTGTSYAAQLRVTGVMRFKL